MAENNEQMASSSNQDASSTTGNPRLRWDELDGIRTLLFVLYKRYTYWNASQYAQILNEICKTQFAAMGFPNGIDNHRIGAEWRARKKSPAKEKWKVVRSKCTNGEDMLRDRFEAIVRITAGRVGLKLQKEVGSGQDGDDATDDEDDEGETKIMTKEEYEADGKAFRAKHEKREDRGGAGGAEVSLTGVRHRRMPGRSP